MADLNVTVAFDNERIQPSVTVSTTKAAETLKEQNKTASSRKEHIKEVLEDVIAVSKDGDTAQASKNAQDKLKENEELGDVKELKEMPSNEPSAAKKLLDEMQKKQESKPSPAEELKQNTEKLKDRISEKKETPVQEAKKEDIFAKKNTAPEPKKPAAKDPMNAPKKSNENSFDSYTDAQLRQMYIKGDISRYDYDHEISNREKNSDVRSAEENDEQVFREGIVRALKNENKAELSGDNIERAFDEDANENMQAEQRMAMIDAAELTG